MGDWKCVSAFSFWCFLIGEANSRWFVPAAASRPWLSECLSNYLARCAVFAHFLWTVYLSPDVWQPFVEAVHSVACLRFYYTFPEALWHYRLSLDRCR